MALVLLIWTASGAFLPLELALNEAWGVKRERGFIRRRLFAALMTLLFGFFILISVFLTTMIVRFDHYLKGLLKDEWHYAMSPMFIKGMLVLVSLGLAVVMFSFIYKFVPYTRVRFAQVIPSAVIGAFTWEIAKYGFTSIDPIFQLHLSLWIHRLDHCHLDLGLSFYRHHLVFCGVFCSILREGRNRSDSWTWCC